MVAFNQICRASVALDEDVSVVGGEDAREMKRPRDDMDTVKITVLLGIGCTPVAGHRTCGSSYAGWPTGGQPVHRRPITKFSAFANQQHRPRTSCWSARHRGHARVEDQVRTTKGTDLDRFPSTFRARQRRLGAGDLHRRGLARLAQVARRGPTTLPRAGPKTLRYRLLFTRRGVAGGYAYRRTGPGYQLAHAIITIARPPPPALA